MNSDLIKNYLILMSAVSYFFSSGFRFVATYNLAEKWCSQPILNRGLHAGDLMLSAAILFSGNNFGKMELFAKFLKLGFPGQSTFTRLQKRYLVPAVDEYWTSQQTGIVDEMSDKDLIILGKKKSSINLLCFLSRL